MAEKRVAECGCVFYYIRNQWRLWQLCDAGHSARVGRHDDKQQIRDKAWERWHVHKQAAVRSAGVSDGYNIADEIAKALSWFTEHPDAVVVEYERDLALGLWQRLDRLERENAKLREGCKRCQSAAGNVLEWATYRIKCARKYRETTDG